MSKLINILNNPVIPDFNQYTREEEAIKLKLDINKLKLNIILDSVNGNIFQKNLSIDGRYSLVVSYDGTGAYVLSFDEVNDGLLIKQLQGAKSKVSYKINTTLNIINFYLDFFKENIIGNFDNIGVIEKPKGLENPGDFFGNDPFLRYAVFKKRLDNILKLQN